MSINLQTLQVRDHDEVFSSGRCSNTYYINATMDKCLILFKVFQKPQGLGWHNTKMLAFREQTVWLLLLITREQ